MRVLRMLLAVGLLALGVPAGALAHGDGPTHYLETFDLYPGFSPEPSATVELQLMGFVQAANTAGYPVKVGLANEGDVTDRPQVIRRPQAYAEDVVASIGYRNLRGPVVIVTPHGVGVAGYEQRGGELRKIDSAAAARLAEGLDLPLHANSDAMAKAAIEATRQVARAGGYPLPAEVPPARLALPPARPTSDATAGGEAAGSGGGASGWLPLAVFGVVFGLAAAIFEIRIRMSRHERLDSASSPN